tara:strand:+ start:2624 stop:3739 length:1116 start_codon:yes stop_codon:yes gene_type:complete
MTLSLETSSATKPHVSEQPVTRNNLLEFLRSALDLARGITWQQGSDSLVRLHHLELTLSTQNTLYRKLVKRRISEQRALDPAADRNPKRLQIAVVSPQDSEMPAPPPWGEAVFHPRQLEQLLVDSPFRATYFHDCRLWQIYDRNQNFGLQWMQNSTDFPAWERGAPLRVFLHWAYQAQGYRLIHAGTLGKHDCGILIVGKGGSGKSGTVIGGIANGLKSVGDDYVLIRPSGERPTAFPLFTTLKQDRSGLERLGLERLAGTHPCNWQNKHEFESHEIAGDQLARSLPIGAVVLPRIAHARHSSIRKLSQSRAMLALAPTGLFQLPGERDSGVRFFSDLIRQLPCFELILGNDPAEVSHTLERLITGGFQCD